MPKNKTPNETKRPMQQNAQCNKTPNYKTPKITKRPNATKGPKSKKNAQISKNYKIPKRSRKKIYKFCESKGVCIISEVGLVRTVSLL